MNFQWNLNSLFFHCFFFVSMCRSFNDMKLLTGVFRCIFWISNRFDGVNSNLGHSTRRRHRLWIIYDQLFIITYFLYAVCGQRNCTHFKMHYSIHKPIVISGYSFLCVCVCLFFFRNAAVATEAFCRRCRLSAAPVLISINQPFHLSPD